MISVELKEKNATNYKIMPLNGIQQHASDLNALEAFIKGNTINQTIPQQITHIASYNSLLALCYANGSVSFLDYDNKSERTINNVIETVRFIRTSSCSSSSNST